MINSRKIEDLHPHVQKLCHAFLDACTAQGIDVLITSTYRDDDAQNALYAQGRTAPGARVTNARGGESYHQYRCAFDFVPILNGKARWGDLKTITQCGALGEQVGLTWAGRWTGALHESLHLQWSGGLSLSDLRAGKPLPEITS